MRAILCSGLFLLLFHALSGSMACVCRTATFCLVNRYLVLAMSTTPQRLGRMVLVLNLVDMPTMSKT